MKTATKIMSEFDKATRPSGPAIGIEQIPMLVSHLRRRLNTSEAELDSSPLSLKVLEDRLLKLVSATRLPALAEGEVIEFIREIAAYLGEVLLTHTDGRWETSHTLWGTRFVIEGDASVIKEGSRRAVSSVAFSLGNVAAAALDLAALGKKPVLYRIYKSAKSKKVKEGFGRSEKD